MPWGQRLLHTKDLLAGNVRFSKNRGLPKEEIQWGHPGDDEPGRHWLHGGQQELQEAHENRSGVF